jgi:UV excision repair protein RAD23
MQLSVRIIRGPTFQLEAQASDSILSVKQKIAAARSVPVSKQFLVVKNKWLENKFNHLSLQDFNVTEGDSMSLLVLR